MSRNATADGNARVTPQSAARRPFPEHFGNRSRERAPRQSAKVYRSGRYIHFGWDRLLQLLWLSSFFSWRPNYGHSGFVSCGFISPLRHTTSSSFTATGRRAMRRRLSRGSHRADDHPWLPGACPTNIPLPIPSLSLPESHSYKSEKCKTANISGLPLLHVNGTRNAPRTNLDYQ